MLKEKSPGKKKAKKGRGRKDELEDGCSLDANSSEPFNLPGKAQADKSKKHTKERAGDWICQRCFNHNFSFRESCNMCQLGQ